MGKLVALVAIIPALVMWIPIGVFLDRGWMPKDKLGWDIERWGNWRFKTAHRIVCQIIRGNFSSD